MKEILKLNSTLKYFSRLTKKGCNRIESPIYFITTFVGFNQFKDQWAKMKTEEARVTK